MNGIRPAILQAIHEGKRNSNKYRNKVADFTKRGAVLCINLKSDSSLHWYCSSYY